MKKTIALLTAACLLLGGCQLNSQKSEPGAATDSAVIATDSSGSGANSAAPGQGATLGYDWTQNDDKSAGSDASQVPVPEMDAADDQTLFTFSQMSLINNELAETAPDDNYRTTYEVFVYSFADSDGDGIGDLNGLYDNLGYINDGQPSSGMDLSAGEIWLMPIFPSPTYHKYDTTNYMDVDPAYGTLEDFDKLLKECHARGINVILDLALNHTSTEHPWFLAAKEYLEKLPAGKDPVKDECPYVWYYTFSREQYPGFVPMDDTWYYEARFWEGMPDLNLSTPEVRNELSTIMKFWLDRGVDGFRLDAVTSYYTDNPDGNMEFMRWVADTVHGINPKAYLVAEAWTDQSSYASYYSTGVNSFFDFAYSGADGIIAQTARGNMSAKSFAESLANEENLYSSINEHFINAPFYTNHDMPRSAGYYADDDGPRTKLAGALNLLMTGNAFVYYGEELGMMGSGKDPNYRAPMYWISEDECDAAGAGDEAGTGAKIEADTKAAEAKTEADSETTEAKTEADPKATAAKAEADSKAAETKTEADTKTTEAKVEADSKAAGSETRAEVKMIEQEMSDMMCDGPAEMDKFTMKFGSAYSQISDEYSIFNYYRNAIRIRNSFPVIARGRTAVDYDRTNDSVAAFTRKDSDGKYEPVEIFINSTSEPASVDITGSDLRELKAVLTVSSDKVMLDGTTLTLPAFGICVMGEAK